MLKQEGPVLPQSNRTLPQTHATYECKEVLSYESGGVAPHTPQTETKRPVRRRGRTHSVDIGAASNGKREQMRGTEKAPARALPRRAKSDDSLAYMLPSNTAATANCSNRPAYGLDCEVLLTRDRLKATQDIDVDFSPLKTSPRTFADKRPSMIEGIVGLSGIQALANSSRQMKEIAVDFSPLQSTPRSSENRRVIAVGSMSAFLSTPSQGDAAAAVPNTSKETIHWSPIYHSPVKVSKRARDCPSRNRSDGVPKREAVRSRNGQFLAPTRSKSDEGLFHMAYLATSTRGNQNRDKPPRPRARTNDEQTVNGSVDDTSVQDIAVDFSPVKTPLSRTADDRRPSLMEELVGLNGVESLVQQVAINELVALHASMLDGDGYDVVTAMKDDLMAASNGIDCDRSSNTSVVKPKTDRALCQPNRSRSGNIARRTSSNTHGPRRGVTRRHTSDCTLLQMACIASSVADEAKDVKPPAVAVMVEPTEEHPVDAPLCITHDKSQDQHQLEGASLQNLLNDLKCFSGHTRVRRASTASMAAGPIPESTSKLDSLATDTVAVELDTSLHKPTPTLKTSTYEGVQHSKKVIYIDKRRPASAVSDINTEHVESKSRLASILNAPRSRPLDESFASSMLFETSMSFDLSTIERRHSQVSRPTENGTACQPLPDPPTPDTSESFDSGFTDSAKHKSIVASLSPTTNPSKFKRDVINSDRFGRGRGLTNLEKP
jgi:hypothetical protein